MGGWIKLHRKIQDHWIWQDPEKLRAWLDILMMVNHEEKTIPIDGHMVTIKRGQRLTSIYQLAERWGWSRNRVYRFISLLKEDGMCNVNGTTNGTIITVVNWDFYQLDGYTDGTTNGTTSGTTNGTTDGTKTRKNKNYKERENSPHELTDEEVLAILEELNGKDSDNGVN